METMKIIKDKITLLELKTMAKNSFGDLVKAVVDIDKVIMAVDAPLHADEEAELIKKGSNQEYLWGINLYPDEKVKNFVEFDSIINLRPNQNNRSRGIDNPAIRKDVLRVVNRLVKKWKLFFIGDLRKKSGFQKIFLNKWQILVQKFFAP